MSVVTFRYTKLHMIINLARICFPAGASVVGVVLLHLNEKDLIGTLFFGLCSAALVAFAFYRVRSVTKPIVIISENGFTDNRLTAEEIPWSAINNVTIATRGQSRVYVLDLKPETKARLAKKWKFRMFEKAGAKFGMGPSLTADGLDVSLDALVAAIRKQHRFDGTVSD